MILSEWVAKSEKYAKTERKNYQKELKFCRSLQLAHFKPKNDVLLVVALAVAVIVVVVSGLPNFLVSL